MVCPEAEIAISEFAIALSIQIGPEEEVLKFVSEQVKVPAHQSLFLSKDATVSMETWGLEESLKMSFSFSALGA